MIKNVKRRSKYYAPQNEGKSRKCDHPGCQEAGEFRAPKDRRLKEYYWFCLKHVQEYNSKWNYYGDGEGAAEEEKEHDQRRRFRFGTRVKYNFGFDFDGNFDFFNTENIDSSFSSTPYFNAEDLQSLQIMELKADNLTEDLLKKQYKKLVKKYHPDINREDKDAEEKFKRLGAAYNRLLEKITRYQR